MGSARRSYPIDKSPCNCYQAKIVPTACECTYISEAIEGEPLK